MRPRRAAGRCGEDNPARARFCLACAAPLADPVASGRQQRKRVSVLFCDLVGFESRRQLPKVPVTARYHLLCLLAAGDPTVLALLIWFLGRGSAVGGRASQAGVLGSVRRRVGAAWPQAVERRPRSQASAFRASAMSVAT